MRAALTRVALSACCLAAVAPAAGCGRRPAPAVRSEGPASSSAAPPASGGGWLTFAPYPGARQLCWQHVNASAMHILWTGYASTDPPEKVAAFYAGRHNVPAAVPLTVRADRANVLSVNAAAARDYPHCPEGPRPDERSVIIVSHATGR